MATQQELIQILLQTGGVDDAKQVVSVMQGIAASGGEAAPAAQRVLEAFEQLGTQSNAAAALVSLRAELTETADSLVSARLKVEGLEAQFDAAEAPSARLIASLGKARTAVASLQAQFNQQQAAIAGAENALTAAGLSTENLDSTQRGLQAQLAATRAEALGLAAGMNEASVAQEREALTAGEIAERNVVLRASFEQLKELLKTFAGILAFEQLKEDIGDVIKTGDKFEQWGIQFKNAFGGAEQGAEALAKVKEIAEQTPLSLDEVTKAALQAKKEGLDPFNGSLEAIIATSAKYGGDANTVSELITALGKSANQGGLNIRTLTALEQQGIPAAQLLGEALGKTAVQVTELAKQGKLGSDSVALLIEQLGKKSTGGLADEMAIVSTQVTKAHDNWDEFLELIAKSGAYDYVRSQLAALNQSFKEGLESGELQASARSISDGLITLGRTLVTITKFVADNGATIVTLAEQYALFKAVMLGLDLLGAAQRFIGLAEATKVAGAAAEAAAAESGGFGKLRSAINRIPRTVQVAIAVSGAVDAITETVKLIGTLNDYYDLNQKVLAQKQDDATLQARLIALADQTAKRTIAAANTQIASADQLAAKNAAQSTAYLKQLQDAIRYYESIKVQDEAIGNSAGAAAASEKVRQYITALDEATKHQKTLTDSIEQMSGKVALVVDGFDKLYSGGTTAAEAIQKAFDNIEIQTPKGFDAVFDILKRIGIESKDARDAVQTELANSLTKLDAIDLRQFQENVITRIKQLGTSSQETTAALKASLQAELLQLGLTAEQAGLKFTDSGQKIIETFTSVAKNAQASGAQIQLAFAQALSKAATDGEVEALKTQLQDAFAAGRISAAQLQAGVEAAGRKLADLQIGAAEAGHALDGMGQVGSTAAQRVSLQLQKTRDDLYAQAQGISAAINTALAAGNTTTADGLKAQLASIEQQAANLNTEVQKLTPSFNAAGDEALKAALAYQRAAHDTSVANAEADKAAQDAAKSQGYLADEATQAGKEMESAASEGGSSLAELDNALANTRAQFVGVSEAAAKAFDTALIGDFGQKFDSTGIGFARVIGAMNQAAQDVNTTIAGQREQLNDEIGVIDQIGTASGKGFGAFGEDADAASARMQNLSNLIAQGKYQAGLLGQEELGPLRDALDAAIQRTQQLADAAKNAAARLADANDQLLDQLDDANGNAADKENRRYQQQLKQLQDLYQQAGKLGSDQYNQAVANANKLHDLNLQHIQQEQNAKNGTTDAGGGGSTTSTSSSSSGTRSESVPARVNVNGRTYNIHLQNDQQADHFGDMLSYIARAKQNSILQ